LYHGQRHSKYSKTINRERHNLQNNRAAEVGKLWEYHS